MATFPAIKKVDNALLGTRERGWIPLPNCPFDTQVLEQQSFVRALRLEHRRAERSNSRFALLILEVGELLQVCGHAKSLTNIVVAISNSTRETDTLGWYEQGTKLGVLFTDIAPSDNAALIKIVDRITRVLQLTVSAREFESLSLAFGAFPAAHSKDSTPPKPEMVVPPDVSDRTSSTSLQLRHAT